MTNSLPFPHAWWRQWQWRDELVSYVICPAESSPAMTPSEQEAVILVHGFGACKEHWRHTIGPLASHHTIFALDLLGFGASSKPRARLEDEPEESGSCR